VPEAAERAAQGLPVPRRYWAIAAIVLAITMSVLDSSIANVALPTIARRFGTSNSASVWVVNAYQIALLIGLLPLASLGEIVGYRRVSQWGLAVFTVASLGCALAPSLTLLVGARIVQGLGAAGIVGVNAALVRFTYPAALLGRAIAINGFAVASAAALGPTVASGVLALASWRWLFAVNVPIGVATLAIALVALPATARARRGLNYAGAALHALGFGLVLFGLQQLAHRSVSPVLLAQILLGGLLIALLAWRELHRSPPLIPFDLLRIPLFSLSLATSVCSFIAQSAALVALPFEIQRLGYSEVQTGLLMTPWPVAVALMAPIAGRLADRHRAGILGAIGLGLMTLGLAALALYPAHGGVLNFIWRMALCGFGFGFFQTPNNRALLVSAPPARSGSAGGMLGTARLLGQSLGAATVALLLRLAPQSGSNAALSVAAAACAIAALVSTARLGVAGAATAPGSPRPL
jgi:MFS transporter, DHA2 family, multidrug resistance protein